MSRPTAAPRARPDTKVIILEAAKRVLTTHGYAGLSTRAVAQEAGSQMSQIRYHFGSKEGMILALFDYMNSSLVTRQTAAFTDASLSLSQKWARSCDYLDQDLASGYVRVLQELIAAGWSHGAIGQAVRAALGQWRDLMIGLASACEADHGPLGPFRPQDIAALGNAVFLGAEACILLGYEDDTLPVRQALRRFGHLIEFYETRPKME